MLTTTVAKEGKINIIYLSGQLDVLTCDQLTKLLIDVTDPETCYIVLELSKLDYISSNGLRPFLEWLEVSKDACRERKLVVCNLQKFVRTVFSITGFDRKFPLFDSLESALDCF